MTDRKLATMPGFRPQRFPPGSISNKDGRFAHDRVGDLSWVVHPDIASRASRFELINRTAAMLRAHADPARPVTVVSLGSGQLLTEQLLHQQIVKSGFTDLHWRCIDPDYHPVMGARGNGFFEPSKLARTDFGKGKGDVRPFTTAAAYLAKTDGSAGRLADRDKAGTVVILTADPPTWLPGQQALLQPGMFVIRGRSVPADDIEKANAVYLIFCEDAAQAAVLERRVNTDLVGHSQTIRCYLGPDGSVQVRHTGGLREDVGALIERDAESVLQFHPPATRSMRHVLAFADKLASDWRAEGRAVSCMPFSEYERSVDDLVAQFRAGPGAVVLSKLERSRVELTLLKPAG